MKWRRLGRKKAGMGARNSDKAYRKNNEQGKRKEWKRKNIKRKEACVSKEKKYA